MNIKDQIELKKLAKKIMHDSYNQDKLYTAGNYWKFYEKNILKQIEKNDLSKFRSWVGGQAVGNIQSFGGGDENIVRTHKINFHPFDDEFKIIDNSFILDKYNSLLNRLIIYFPFLKFFIIRISEASKYFRDIIKEKLHLKHQLTKNLDNSLHNIHDSEFGFDKKKITYIDGNVCSLQFFDALFKINFIKNNTEFNNIKSIVELGAGIGILASAFLKLDSKIKYLIIDISPTIFFSEFYLRGLGYKVFGYEDFQNQKNIDIAKIFIDYDVICMPSWKIFELGDFEFDLFVNIASIQEMEKEQALNYLSILSKNIKNYIYFQNEIEGQPKAKKKCSFGVINPITYIDIKDKLKSNFEITKEEIENSIYKTIFKKKSY
jgi:putative sugar O-methyltransferase